MNSVEVGPTNWVRCLVDNDKLILPEPPKLGTHWLNLE